MMGILRRTGSGFLQLPHRRHLEEQVEAAMAASRQREDVPLGTEAPSGKSAAEARAEVDVKFSQWAESIIDAYLVLDDEAAVSKEIRDFVQSWLSREAAHYTDLVDSLAIAHDLIQRRRMLLSSADSEERAIDLINALGGMIQSNEHRRVGQALVYLQAAATNAVDSELAKQVGPSYFPTQANFRADDAIEPETENLPSEAQRPK